MFSDVFVNKMEVYTIATQGIQSYSEDIKHIPPFFSTFLLILLSFYKILIIATLRTYKSYNER